MGKIINALKDTPIPTILIIAGLFLILLGFFSKLGVIEVQFAQKRWAALIGIFLLVVGLVLNLNSLPQNEVITFSSQNNCSALFREGNILSWKIRNYGKLGNVGTLEIKNVDSASKWVGDQIIQTKDDLKIRVTGTFNGFTMSLLHPSGAESWFGICNSRKIEGSIKTTYNSQLTFEMQQ
jgi:hypothetical protein